MATYGRDNPKFKHGLFTGWNEYRHGKRKKLKPQRLIVGEKRDHVIGKIIDRLRDWRSSPFEFEGACRAGMRSALCIQGHAWHLADREAANLVAESLRIIGAKYPTWEQGQPEYVVAEEDCRWCGAPVPDELRISGSPSRYCSAGCARNAITRREYQQRSSSDKAYNAAFQTIVRAMRPLIKCEGCDKTFRPIKENAKFCSMKCHAAHRTTHPLRECKACGTSFRPSGRNVGKYCSRSCADRSRSNNEYPGVCAFCHGNFIASSPRAKCCSPRCAQYLCAVRAGTWRPKQMTVVCFDHQFGSPSLEFVGIGRSPHVFDSWFKRAA